VSFVVLGTGVCPAGLRGCPRPVNDPWIAASCLVRGLPLAALDIKGSGDVAGHGGPRIAGISGRWPQGDAGPARRAAHRPGKPPPSGRAGHRPRAGTARCGSASIPRAAWRNVLAAGPANRGSRHPGPDRGDHAGRAIAASSRPLTVELIPPADRRAHPAS
jgi:hypothetical protein